jgi:hypothetical protein
MSELCVTCGVEPATSREHVLPRWYLRDRELEPPPFKWSVNDERIRRQNGEFVELPERVRVLIPMCRWCNGELDRRFEKPAKGALRRLFAERGHSVLDESEAEAVGLWFAKTMLLHAHPRARHSDAVINQYAVRWTEDTVPPDRFYRWLIDGCAPPDGLSVWAFRTDEHDGDPGVPEFRVPLPDVSCGEVHLSFVCFQMSFHGLHVTVVVHPGWPILHPLEADGRAVRWLPTTGATDLTGLPVLPRRAIAWRRYDVVLAEGALGSPELPPLQHSGLPFEMQPDAGPLVKSWSFGGSLPRLPDEEDRQ